MKNLIFTRNFVYSTLTVLFLVFSVHGIANAQGTLVISPTFISGQPGDEYLITITLQDANGDPASDVLVAFAVSEPSGWFSPTSDVTNSDGIVESILTLPIRSATLYVRATGYSTASMLVKVMSIPDRLVKVSGDNQRSVTGTRLPLPFIVRVDDVNDYALPGKWVTFSVISGGGYLSTTTARTDSRGEAQTTLTLGEMAGSNIVEVSVREVPPVHFRATAVAIAEKLVISSGAVQTGFPNKRLAAPLAVQVIDSNAYGVENIIITFSVTEGSGRALPSRIRTDKDGFAKTNFIPKSPGTVIVKATAAALLPVTFTVQVSDPPNKVIGISGDNQNSVPGSRLEKPFVVEVRDVYAEPIAGITVNFTVIGGGGSLSAATATTDANGQAQTYLTLGSAYGVNSVKASVSGVFGQVTFRAASEVQVHIDAARCPPLYWIDASAGTLHRLVGAKVENLVPNLQNVTSLAVDVEAGKLYWTEQTSHKTGKIQRANLNGSNVQLLKELTSVPYGIAIDTARNKIYLTNSWGKIQRLNVDGTNFEPNFITGLDSPMDIALDVAGGKVYWTEGAGRIRSANLNSNQSIRNVVTGLGEPLSLAVADGNVYWTEPTGEHGGRIRRIGTNAKNAKNAEELATFISVAQGIAVDTAGRKLYWTNDRGRIQRTGINGVQIRNVATGLMVPGDLVIATPADFLIETGTETTQMAPTAVVRPDETVLLANYPNPFNPETWIPYHLATGTDVQVNIYNTQGTLVRMLTLGHQSAGYYTSRSRAAYWDGRNAFGECVASGIYFYQLQTDKISPIRKMVILK